MAYASATFAGLKPVYGGIQGDPFPGKTVTTRKPGQFYIDSEPVGVPNATTCRINPQDIGKILAHDGVGETVRIWHPSDIPGLTMALLPDPTTMVSDIDFSIPAGIGEPVRAWLDSSGNGNHAEQATANRQPRRGFLGAKGNILRSSGDLMNPAWHMNNNQGVVGTREYLGENCPYGTPATKITLPPEAAHWQGVNQRTLPGFDIQTYPGRQVQISWFFKALTEYPITARWNYNGSTHDIGTYTIDDDWILCDIIITGVTGAHNDFAVCSNPEGVERVYAVGKCWMTEVSWGHWIYNVDTTDEAVIPQEGDYPAAVYAGYSANTHMELNPEIFQGDWEMFFVNETPGNRQTANGSHGLLQNFDGGPNHSYNFRMYNHDGVGIPGPGNINQTASPRFRVNEAVNEHQQLSGPFLYNHYDVNQFPSNFHSRRGVRPTLRNVRSSSGEWEIQWNGLGTYSGPMQSMLPTTRSILGGDNANAVRSSRSNLSAVITYDRNLTEQERNRVNDFLQVACKIHLPGPGR